MPGPTLPIRCAPYPELVEAVRSSARWRVRDSNHELLPSNGVVSLVERWIAVPLDPYGRPVARHELGHVAFSPPRLPRVRFDPRILAAVEDARINLALGQRGVPMRLDADAVARVLGLLEADAARGDVFAMLMRSIASIGSSARPALEDLLAREAGTGRFVAQRGARVAQGLETSRRRHGGDVAPFRAGLRLARELARELRRVRLLDARGLARSEFGREIDGILIDGHAGPAGSSAPGDRGGGRGEPGQMHVVRAPLGVSLHRSGGQAGRGAGSRREGSVVRHVHRWSSDRAIFRGTRRGGAATLLVDTSGSMSLTAEDVDRLLLATPRGATVAIYSGRDSVGELRIVASGTRRAAARFLEAFGPGNIVDAPALEWLARRPGPRLWISDGRVTGIGDTGSAALRRRCERICERASIERLESIAGAIEHLSGGRPPCA